MINPFLKPRLNYDFSLFDFIYCLSSINKENHPYKLLYDLFKTKNILFTNHARTGLRLILNSLNLPENAKIGVQAYNCHTVFQAINKSGYRPIFIDINNSFTIDTNDLNKKKDSLDALIITHIFGIPAEFDQIKSIIPNIPIIEDCAHSFLSTYKGKLTGTLGDAAIFSFGHGKFPSIGHGGYIIVNNDKYLNKIIKGYEKLPSMSRIKEIKYILMSIIITVAYKRPIYGLVSQTLGKILDKKFDFNKKFEFNEFKGLNSFISLLFKNFDNFHKDYLHQRKNAKLIISELGDDLKFVSDIEDNKNNFFMIPTLTKNRDGIIKKSIRNGVELGKHFFQSIEWAKNYGYNKGSCPTAEKIVDVILTIPTYYKMSSFNLENIKKFINK